MAGRLMLTMEESSVAMKTPMATMASTAHLLARSSPPFVPVSVLGRDDSCFVCCFISFGDTIVDCVPSVFDSLMGAMSSDPVPPVSLVGALKCAPTFFAFVSFCCMLCPVPGGLMMVPVIYIVHYWLLDR